MLKNWDTRNGHLSKCERRSGNIEGAGKALCNSDLFSIFLPQFSVYVQFNFVREVDNFLIFGGEVARDYWFAYKV